MSRVFRATGGATSIEYAVIASMVSILILAGATSIGTNLLAFFHSISAYL